MKVNVSIDGGSLLIPIPDDEMTVQWLASESVRRCREAQGESGDESTEVAMFTVAGHRLHLEDKLSDLLSDNDTIICQKHSNDKLQQVVVEYKAEALVIKVPQSASYTVKDLAVTASNHWKMDPNEVEIQTNSGVMLDSSVSVVKEVEIHRKQAKLILTSDDLVVRLVHNPRKVITPSKREEIIRDIAERPSIEPSTEPLVAEAVSKLNVPNVRERKGSIALSEAPNSDKVQAKSAVASMVASAVAGLALNKSGERNPWIRDRAEWSPVSLTIHQVLATHTSMFLAQKWRQSVSRDTLSTDRFTVTSVGAILYMKLDGASQLVSGQVPECVEEDRRDSSCRSKIALSSHALSLTLDRLYAPLIDAICKNGGDIIQCTLDSIIAVWQPYSNDFVPALTPGGKLALAPPGLQSPVQRLSAASGTIRGRTRARSSSLSVNSGNHTRMRASSFNPHHTTDVDAKRHDLSSVDAVRLAAQCGVELINLSHGRLTHQDDRLSVSIGISVGKIQGTQVGGDKDVSCHMLYSGSGLDAAREAASSSGKVIATVGVWNSVADHFITVDDGSIGESKTSFIDIREYDTTTSMFTQNDTILDSILACQYLYPKQLLSHVFASLSDTNLLAGERSTCLGLQPDLDGLARVVVVAVCGVEDLHGVTQIAQRAATRHGGDVFEVTTDSILIGFGLPPMLLPVPVITRQAVRAAWHILSIAGSGGVGVACGWAFCSSVGSQTTRRVQMVVGDVIMDATALAQRAVSNAQLLCCQTTIDQCDSDSRVPKIRFESVDDIDDSIVFHGHEAIVEISGHDTPSKTHRFDPPWHESGVIGHVRARAEIWHRARSFSREPSAFSGAILLEGASGTGRSALLNEVLSSVKNETGYLSLRVLRVVCEPSTKLTPYYAIHTILAQLLGLHRSNSAEELAAATNKIMAWLKEEEDLQNLYPLLNMVLPPHTALFDDTVQNLPKHNVCGDMNRRVRSDARLELVLTLLRSAASEYSSGAPLLLAIEEAQWLDSASMRILAELVSDGHDPAPLLMIVTAADVPPTPTVADRSRGSLTEEWTQWRPHYLGIIRNGPFTLSLHLESLRVAEVSALAARAACCDEIDPKLASKLLKASEGVAAKVELMVAWLLSTERADIVPSGSTRAIPRLVSTPKLGTSIPIDIEEILADTVTKKYSSWRRSVLCASALLGSSVHINALAAVLGCQESIDDNTLVVPDSSRTIDTWKLRSELISLVDDGLLAVPTDEWRSRGLLMLSSGGQVKRKKDKRRPPLAPLPGAIDDEDEQLDDVQTPIYIPDTFFFPAEIIRHAIIKRFVKKQAAAEWHEAAATYYERLVKKRLTETTPNRLNGTPRSEDDEERLSRIFSTRSRSIFRAPAFLKRTNTVRKDMHTVGAGAGLPPLDRDYVEALSHVIAAVSRHWTLALGLGHFKDVKGESKANEVTQFVPAGGAVGAAGVNRVMELVHALNLLSVGGQRSIALRCPAEAFASFQAGKRLCMVYIDGRAALPVDNDGFQVTSQHLRILAARFSRMAGEACVQITRLARDLHSPMQLTDPVLDARNHFMFALQILNRSLPTTIFAKRTAYFRVITGQRIIPNFCQKQNSVVLADVRQDENEEAIVGDPVAAGSKNYSSSVEHEELRCLVDLGNWYRGQGDQDNALYVTVRSLGKALPGWRAGGSKEALADFVEVCTEVLNVAIQRHSIGAVKTYHDLLFSATGTFDGYSTNHKCTVPVPLGGDDGQLAGQIHAAAALALGRSFAVQGRFDDSITVLSTCCSYYEHVFDKEMLSKSAISLCHVHFVVGGFVESHKSALLALDCADALQDDLRRVQALIMVAHCCLELDDGNAAAAALSEAQSIVESWRNASFTDTALYSRRRRQVLTHLGLIIALAYLRSGQRQEAYDVMGVPCEELASDKPLDIESVSGYCAAAEVLLTLLEGEYLISIHHAGEFVSPKMSVLAILTRRVLESFDKFTKILPSLRMKLLLWHSLCDYSSGNDHAAEETIAKSLKMALDYPHLPYEAALVEFHIGRRGGGVAAEREAKLNEALAVFRNCGARHYEHLTDQQLNTLIHNIDIV